MYITLSEVKAHLNIDYDFHDDDRYLLDLVEVCESAVSKRIDRRLEDCIDPTTGRLEASVMHAVKLLIGTCYSQREATSPQQVRETALGFDFLSDLNRKYTIV